MEIPNKAALTQRRPLVVLVVVSFLVETCGPFIPSCFPTQSGLSKLWRNKTLAAAAKKKNLFLVYFRNFLLTR
jgi:hypothetical protein